MTDFSRGRRQTRYEPELAQAAKEMLEASGLTREEVARRSNISPEWLRQLLNLGRVISDDLIADFAEAVSGDADVLLVAAGRKRPAPKDLVKTVEIALRSVSGLSQEDANHIMKVVIEVSERDGKRSP
ncbi:MAG: helix-turn-helix transcriptional regulator [Armatimonadota bacterium]|nr:helix-turn-helix transcriptional regulator [bacterium]